MANIKVIEDTGKAIFGERFKHPIFSGYIVGFYIINKVTILKIFKVKGENLSFKIIENLQHSFAMEEFDYWSPILVSFIYIAIIFAANLFLESVEQLRKRSINKMKTWKHFCDKEINEIISLEFNKMKTSRSKLATKYNELYSDYHDFYNAINTCVQRGKSASDVKDFAEKQLKLRDKSFKLEKSYTSTPEGKGFDQTSYNTKINKLKAKITNDNDAS